jgi:hypothetical protein
MIPYLSLFTLVLFIFIIYSLNNIDSFNLRNKKRYPQELKKEKDPCYCCECLQTNLNVTKPHNYELLLL